MAANRKENEPVFGREGPFRQRLNQLRTTGYISTIGEADQQLRSQELGTSTYLANVHQTLKQQDPHNLETIALLDSLTQLYNQRTIERVLKDEIKRARRYKAPISILLLTVDGLNKIGVGQGKMASDVVLQGLASFLMRSIRDVDIPGRYDAEKLLVVCPHTDAAGVAVLAERIRGRIASERIADVGQNKAITISIGIASFPGTAHTSGDLIGQAQRGLSQAQKNGGNSVVIA